MKHLSPAAEKRNLQLNRSAAIPPSGKKVWSVLPAPPRGYPACNQRTPGANSLFNRDRGEPALKVVEKTTQNEEERGGRGWEKRDVDIPLDTPKTTDETSMTACSSHYVEPEMLAASSEEVASINSVSTPSNQPRSQVNAFKMTASESDLRILVAQCKKDSNYYDPELVPFETVLEVFWESFSLFHLLLCRENLEPSLLEPLKKEAEYKDRIAMYSGMNSLHAMCMDVASELRFQYLKGPRRNIKYSWEAIWPESSRNVKTMSDFYDHVLMPKKREAEALAKKHNPWGFEAWMHYRSGWTFTDWRHQGVNVNFSLFSNIFNRSECSLCFWHHNTSTIGNDFFEAFDDQLKPILKHIITSEIGFRNQNEAQCDEIIIKLKDKLREALKLHTEEKGRLLALYARPDIVDRIAYIGIHEKVEMDVGEVKARSLSEILTLQRNDPETYRQVAADQFAVCRKNCPIPKFYQLGRGEEFSNRLFGSVLALPECLDDELVKMECFDLFTKESNKETYNEIIKTAVSEFLEELNSMKRSL